MRVFCCCFVFWKHCCETLSGCSSLKPKTLGPSTVLSNPASVQPTQSQPVSSPPLSECLTLIALPLQLLSCSAASSPSISGCVSGPFVLVRGAHFQARQTINLSDSAEISNIELDVCVALRYISTCHRMGCSESKISALNCRNVSETISLASCDALGPYGDCIDLRNATTLAYELAASRTSTYHCHFYSEPFSMHLAQDALSNQQD